MKRLILIGLAMSVLTVQSVFAQDLGVLSDENKPQNLISSQEFLNTLNAALTSESQSVNELGTDNSSLNANETNARYRHRGGYYGGYYPYYYPSYYYPYYGYPSYYYPYYYGYGRHHRHHRRHLNETPNVNARTALESSESSSDTSNTAMDASQTPVVCFASNESGNWYAMADVASNVLSTQEAANSACLASGVNCTQNLGCAIAFK